MRLAGLPDPGPDFDPEKFLWRLIAGAALLLLLTRLINPNP